MADIKLFKSKTKVINFNKIKKEFQQPELNIKNNKIERVRQINILGLIFDKKLS